MCTRLGQSHSGHRLHTQPGQVADNTSSSSKSARALGFVQKYIQLCCARYSLAQQQLHREVDGVGAACQKDPAGAAAALEQLKRGSNLAAGLAACKVLQQLSRKLLLAVLTS